MLKATIIRSEQQEAKPARSQQVPLWTEAQLRQYNAIKPMYDKQDWAAAMESATRLKKSIQIMAHNTVGLGYEIEEAQ